MDDSPAKKRLTWSERCEEVAKKRREIRYSYYSQKEHQRKAMYRLPDPTQGKVKVPAKEEIKTDSPKVRHWHFGARKTKLTSKIHSKQEGDGNVISAPERHEEPQQSQRENSTCPAGGEEASATSDE
jgi:hypothetical protein